MTRGQRLIGSLRIKDRFYDAHERRSYLRTVEVAKRIVDDPSLIEEGRDYLERFVRDDPHQRGGYELWTETLQLPPEEIARRLLSDTENGAELRNTAPVFVVISAGEAQRLWAENA